MKKRIVLLMVAMAIAFVTPTMNVKARATDQLVINGVNSVKAGYIPEEAIANDILTGGFSKSQIEYVLNQGVCTGYIDQFKEAGVLPQDYGTTTASKAETPQTPSQEQPQKATPVETEKAAESEITIAPMSAILYATQNVNLREGAAVTYKKVGSLTKDQAVTVTGRASTGWYEIEWNNGKAYVSDKYLSETGPTVAEIEAEVEVEPQTIEAVAEQPTETIAISEMESEVEIPMETIFAEEEETTLETEQAVSETKTFPISGIVVGVVLLIAAAAAISIYTKKKKE